MEDDILKSLLKRPGMNDKEDLLKDLIADSISEMKDNLNYDREEDLPDSCDLAVKDLTLYKFNLDGVEGIVSESRSSGGSTTYSDDLPKSVKRAIRRHRRLRR